MIPIHAFSPYSHMNTPIAFLIFNRPEVTRVVFAAIARAKPEKLLVVADGPRTDRPGEAEKCTLTRAIIDQVNWECDVQTNYSPVNLGCGRRVSTGISWVFEQVQEAIILEDDCVPHPSFFPFCEELLARYRDNKRVTMISGDCFLPSDYRTVYSYFFNRNMGMWGWATWCRAWQHHDVFLRRWPELRETDWLRDVLKDPVAARAWKPIFDKAHAGRVDTWDFHWTFSMWSHDGLCASPGVNLVSNIGFGPDATHTKMDKSSLSALPVEEMVFPLRHPPSVSHDHEADRAVFRRAFGPQMPATPSPLLHRIQRRFWAGLPRPVRQLLERVGIVNGAGGLHSR